MTPARPPLLPNQQDRSQAGFFGDEGGVLKRHLDSRAALGLTTPVRLYALVAADSNFAIDLFPSRAAAEAALRQVLADEPAFIDLLSITPLDDEMWWAEPPLN